MELDNTKYGQVRFAGTGGVYDPGTLGANWGWTSAASVAKTDNSTKNASSTKATWSHDDNRVSEYLLCTNFDFAIPTQATITNVWVEGLFTNTTVSVTQNSIKLQNSGVIGNEKASGSISTSAFEIYNWGGDGLWGATLTPAIVNGSNFGVGLSFSKPGTAGGAGVLSCFYVLMGIEYTLPAAAGALVGLIG